MHVNLRYLILVAFSKDVVLNPLRRSNIRTRSTGARNSQFDLPVIDAEFSPVLTTRQAPRPAGALTRRYY
jgi:hypothetical protein